jgi:FkbM family methyltransferase
MFRALAERFARNVSYFRRLPKDFGGLGIYVSPDSQLKYLKPGSGGFDRSLLQLVREQVEEDSVVWDIGANVGVFAFAAAGLASRGAVVALEPDIWLAALLRRSASAQGPTSVPVRVVPCAAADTDGVAEFVIAMRGRASNYLARAGGWTQSGGARERVYVPTLTLDSLLACQPRPSFVKIDVEGAEVMVLNGAKRLLTEVRPKLYVEVGEQNVEAATKLLKAAGYAIFDSSRPRSLQAPLPMCVHDTLAYPL